MATISSSELKLWVYTGEINSYDPASPNYTITKTPLPGEGNVVFEIAELAKDFIPIYFDGDYATAVLTAWASWQITTTYSDGTTGTKSDTILATHGYGYFEDEINPQLISNPLQQSNTCIYWKSDEKIRVPLYRDTELYSLEFFIGDTSVEKTTYGNAMEYFRADTTEIRADSILYRADLVSRASSTSGEQVQDGMTNVVGVNKIILTTSDNQQINLTINLIEECKNTPYKITFINKFGSLQDIWMFGRRKEQASATRDSYKVNTIESPTTGVYYPTNKSTDRLFDINATKSLTLNTGFVCEDYNEVVQQLLLSENVWIHENNKVFPIVPKDNVVEYKTHLYEKLLNYTINFDYAYSEINLVR